MRLVKTSGHRLAEPTSEIVGHRCQLTLNFGRSVQPVRGTILAVNPDSQADFLVVATLSQSYPFQVSPEGVVLLD